MPMHLLMRALAVATLVGRSRLPSQLNPHQRLRQRQVIPKFPTLQSLKTPQPDHGSKPPKPL